MNKVYLCGPITGRSYGECYEERKENSRILEIFGFKVLNPLRDKEALEGVLDIKAEGYENQALLLTADGFFTRDLMWIDECDIVFAYFKDSASVSKGSCVEIGYAYAKNKIIVAVVDSAHDHPFITKCSSVCASTLYEALDYIKNLYV